RLGRTVAEGYEPIPLTEHCNCGTEVLDGTPPVGSVQLRGLPFIVGPAPDRCFVRMGGDAQNGERAPLRINLGRSGHWMIFAHVLLSSEVPNGGPLGVTVAHYEFTLADGARYSVPIRERFEISDMEELPALALPDAIAQPRPRFTARFMRGNGPPDAF